MTQMICGNCGIVDSSIEYETSPTYCSKCALSYGLINFADYLEDELEDLDKKEYDANL